MEKDLVSIITPVYNSEKYIRETYESIKNQTYKKWEWIIIDDCSKDESLSILKQIQIEDDRIKIIKNEINLKAAKSRNKGLDISNGEYITFIDSDDIWDRQFLENQISLINIKRSNVVYGGYKRVSESRKLEYGDYIVPEEINYNDLLKENYMSCLTVLFRSDIKLRFNENLKKHEDFIFWLQLLEKNKAYSNNKILAEYRIRKGSVSRNKIKNLYHMYIALYSINKFNGIEIIRILLKYIYYGIKKNKKILMNKTKKR